MDYADDYTNYGNSVLYNMCEDRLLHDDCDIIKSKLWIIGRAYAASIERKAGSGFRIEDAAEILRLSEIDAKIATLRETGRPTQENIKDLLSVHHYLMGLFKEATNVEKRSLASKYLHFHAPKSVFIYDSIVRNNLRTKLSGKRFLITKEFDDEYESHVMRCLYYRDHIYENKLGKLATPRKLDSHLYS